MVNYSKISKEYKKFVKSLKYPEFINQFMYPDYNDLFGIDIFQKYPIGFKVSEELEKQTTDFISKFIEKKRETLKFPEEQFNLLIPYFRHLAFEKFHLEYENIIDIYSKYESEKRKEFANELTDYFHNALFSKKEFGSIENLRDAIYDFVLEEFAGLILDKSPENLISMFKS